MNLEGFRVGIFIDHDNLVHDQDRTGLDYGKIIQFVEDRGMQIVQATTYMAVDYEREHNDEEFRELSQAYRQEIRSLSFRVFEKKLMRYDNGDGTTRYKGNVDLELAIDALTQADGYDLVLLGTGDGDFKRLVSALQSKGKRVEGFSFRNYSRALGRQLDQFYTGKDIDSFWKQPVDLDPQKKPQDQLVTPIKDQNKAIIVKPRSEPVSHKPETLRGKITQFDLDKGYGHIVPESKMDLRDAREHAIFFHISDVRDAYFDRPDNLAVHKYMLDYGWLEYVESTNDKGACAKHIRLIEDDS